MNGRQILGPPGRAHARRVIATVAVALSTSALAAGCATDDAPDAIVTSTSVEVDDDGNVRVVSVERLTVAEMQSQIRARHAQERSRRASPAGSQTGAASQALEIDASCGTNSLWIYDKRWNGLWNSGNRLCIRGYEAGGDVGGDFGDLCRTWAATSSPPWVTCTSTWAGHFRAVWIGQDRTAFYTGGCTVTYNAYAGPRNVPLCAETDEVVEFAMGNSDFDYDL
jgi:hypothetical protein